MIATAIPIKTELGSSQYFHVVKRNFPVAPAYSRGFWLWAL